MSACNDFEIEGLVFGGLTPVTAREARAHLASCPRCSDEYAVLVEERRLFVERKRHGSFEAQSRDSLPDVEAIFSRANGSSSRLPTSLFRRMTASSVESSFARSHVGRVAIALTAGICLIGLTRSHAALPTSHVIAARSTSIAVRAALESSAPVETAKACDAEEAVCRQTHEALWRIDQAMSAATPVEKSRAECDRSSDRSQTSVLPSLFERARSDGDAMCVADAI